MWDLRDDPRLAAIAASILERGGVVAAVCHGPAGLLGIRLSDGSTIVEGRDVTGFTNDEEELLSYDDVVPYLLEDELEASGGNFVPSLFPFTSNVVVSGRLVTGQNPMSTDETADAVIDVLRKIHRR
jgi:putative intracellular protease/amidase